VFTRINDELSRTYTFISDGRTVPLTIEKPKALHVSASGGHRIIDGDDQPHYVPSGWIHLTWKNTPGAVPFQF
jgi:hypothetical protein